MRRPPPELAERLEPWDALAAWLDSFVDYVATKHALVDEMLATMTKDDPVFKTCHDRDPGGRASRCWRGRRRPARCAPDLEFVDLIRMVGGITMLRNSTPEEVRRILGVALDGLRYRRLTLARGRRVRSAGRPARGPTPARRCPAAGRAPAAARPVAVRSGTTPAHASPATSSSGSSGHPPRPSATTRSIGSASTCVARQFGRSRAPQLGDPARDAAPR